MWSTTRNILKAAQGPHLPIGPLILKITLTELKISLKTQLAIRERGPLDWKSNWGNHDSCTSVKAGFASGSQWGGAGGDIAEKLGEGVWKNLENKSLGWGQTKWPKQSHKQFMGSGTGASRILGRPGAFVFFFFFSHQGGSLMISVQI